MRKTTGFLLILFIGVYLAAAMRDFALHTNVSDDSLWYYYSGRGVIQRSTFDREREFLPTVKALAEDDIAWQRVRMRAGYTGNYLLPSVVCFYVGNAIADVVSPEVDFNRRLAEALYWGYLAALILGAIVAALAFLATTRAMQFSLLVALVVIAGLDLLTVDGGLGVLSTDPLTRRELMAIPYRLLLIFVDPHFAIAPFGAMARNQIIFIALCVYALRWTGKPAAAYALMIVLLLFHQSMAFLLLALLLAVDVATRPQIFRQRWCATAAGAALALGLLREELWAGIGQTGGMVLAAAAILALAAVTLVAFAMRRRGAAASVTGGAYGRWLERWRQQGDVMTDVLGLSAIFIVVLITATIANQLAAPLNQQYFWAILPGRLFAMLRPLYFLAGAIWLGGFLASRLGARGRAALAGAGLATVATLIAVEILLTPPLAPVSQRMASTLNAVDASLQTPSTVFRNEDEPRYYYSLIKSLDTGVDYLRKIWPVR